MARVIPIQRGCRARRLPDAAPGLPDAAPGQTVNVCPDDPEDMAEQYLLRSLPPAESERFEEHYMQCERCADFLSAAEDYVSSIRVAGLRLAKSGLRPV